MTVKDIWKYAEPVDADRLPEWINAATWQKDEEGYISVKTSRGWVSVEDGDTLTLGDGGDIFVYTGKSTHRLIPREPISIN